VDLPEIKYNSMAKSCQNIVNERIAKISELMIEGKSRQNILQFNSENWNLSERQIDNYIGKATAIIKQELIKDSEFSLSKAIKRFEYIYQRAIETKDYRLAMQTNKEICTVQGLTKIEIEHSGNITFVCNVPD
jgi:hypothetical protein